jgi:hypothetical protein
MFEPRPEIKMAMRMGDCRLLVSDSLPISDCRFLSGTDDLLLFGNRQSVGQGSPLFTPIADF